MNTVIVIGNGFDIDLGWQTSCKDFYVANKCWEMFKTGADDLFQYVIEHVRENWFDFEHTLYDYVIHRANVEMPKEVLYKDKHDYNILKDLLYRFISERSKKDVQIDSYAYQLLKAYLKTYERLRPSSNMFLKWFSFNYTPLKSVVRQIDPHIEFNYIPVHGTIENNNIIFGIHDDDRILPKYRYLQKSMDDKYESHGILPALIEAKQIIFFGLSMGCIDAIYFKNLFNQLTNIDSNQVLQNKNIIFITKDKDTKKDIKNNLLDMGVKTQILFNTNNVDFIFTSENENKENQAKFASLLEKLYLQDI